MDAAASLLTGDRHKQGRGGDDPQHLRAEGSQHDRDDPGDEVGGEGHVVRLDEPVKVISYSYVMSYVTCHMSCHVMVANFRTDKPTKGRDLL